MSHHRTPTLGDLGLGAAAGSRNLAAFPPSPVEDLRPLAAFLDLALPLDRDCSILGLTPPAPANDSLEEALEATISARIAEFVETGREDEARRLYGNEEVDGWFRAQGWDPDAGRTEMCGRCHTRPVKHTRASYCGGCSELMLDIAAGHRYFDEVNDYGCEGEAA